MKQNPIRTKRQPQKQRTNNIDITPVRARPQYGKKDSNYLRANKDITMMPIGRSRDAIVRVHISGGKRAVTSEVRLIQEPRGW